MRSHTNRFASRYVLTWALALSSAGGCGANPVEQAMECQAGQTRCSGQDYQTCTDMGQFATQSTCGTAAVCIEGVGCGTCKPGALVCANGNLHRCDPDGKVGGFSATCEFGQVCSDGTCIDACELNASEYIYLVDSNNNLLRYSPRADTQLTSLVKLGTLACPTSIATAEPFSMSVDRRGRAWVLYDNGQIFWVNPLDRSCKNSGYQPNQMSLPKFGMGFVSDGLGARTETLFVGGGPNTGGTSNTGAGAGLASISPTTLLLTKINLFPTIEASPEFSGTGDAKFYGYIPSNLAGKHLIARVNRMTAGFEQTWVLPPLPGDPDAWAFAHWGGRFYQFVSVPSGISTVNHVYRFDPATNQQVRVLMSHPYRIVGAGVSTCAPYQAG